MPSSFWWMADMAGCGFYRMAQPASQLPDTEAGFIMPTHILSQHMDVPSELRERYTEAPTPEKTDVVIGQRVCMEAPSSVWQLLSMRDEVKLVYEIDDLLTHVEKSNVMAYQFFNMPNVKKAITTNLSVADAVIASTEPLARELQVYNPNVYVLPNYIDETVLDLPRREPSTTKEVVIGWSGGNSHDGDFKNCKQAVSRVLHRTPNTSLKTVGHDINQAVFNSQLPNVEHHPWVEGFSRYYQQLDFDIGLAPLRVSRFNASKSWLRCLEYAARGIPVVATDCEAYSEFVVHEQTGLLVSRDKEWREAIMYLIEEPDQRLRMAATAKKYAENFTIQENAWRYENVLSEVCQQGVLAS